MPEAAARVTRTDIEERRVLLTALVDGQRAAVGVDAVIGGRSHWRRQTRNRVQQPGVLPGAPLRYTAKETDSVGVARIIEDRPCVALLHQPVSFAVYRS